MKLLRKVASTATAGVVAFSSLLTLAMPGIAHAAAQTCTWVGTAGDNKFSTAANWTTCNGGTPQDGDTVSFDSTVILPTTNDSQKLIINDTNPTLAKVIFSNNDPVCYGKRLYLSQLTLGSNGIVDNTKGSCTTTTSTLAYVYVGIPGATNQDPATLAGLVVKGDFTYPKVFEGDGHFSKLTVDGKLTLTQDAVYSAGDEFTYTKDTVVAASIETSVGLYMRTPDASAVTDSTPITFNEGSSLWVSNASFMADGNIDLTLSGMLTVNTASPLKVTVGTGKLTLSNSGIDKTKFAKANTSSGELFLGATAQQIVAKSTDLSGVTTENVAVGDKETATLQADSARDYISVLSGGVLKGKGTVTRRLIVSNGGIVAPGMSPGCISTANLILSGEYQFELAGSTPCESYDQIKATAADLSTVLVSFKAYMTGEETATLKTIRLNGYTPKQGDVFVIVDNQGSKDVEGTFKGLVEGATFTQNGITFKISYKGGTGNDVTLTVMNQPTTPDTGFALATASNLVALGSSVVVAGGLVLISRKMIVQTKK